MSDILKFRGNTTNSDGKETINAYHHRMALNYRFTEPRGVGAAMRKMLEGWAEYAEASQKAYTEKGEPPYMLADDGVLGEPWGKMGLLIHRLLDGNVGGWDCGSISGNILETLEKHGFHSPDAYQLERKEGGEV